MTNSSKQQQQQLKLKQQRGNNPRSLKVQERKGILLYIHKINWDTAINQVYQQKMQYQSKVYMLRNFTKICFQIEYII